MFDHLGVMCSKEQTTWFRSHYVAVGEYDEKDHLHHIFNTAICYFTASMKKQIMNVASHP